MDKINCSVGILTFNSEKSLRRALDSVKDFSDIIICDGGSTDKTLEIAKEYGCRIISQDPKFKNQSNKISDFSGVRNQLLDAAKFDWFFYLDSDEFLSPELVQEIGQVIKGQETPTAYWILRKYVVEGKIIDCATTYPNKQMRFFHKAAVNRFIKPIHERIEVKNGGKVSQLNNVMLVPMDSDISSMQRKWNYYIDLEYARRGDLTLREWLRVCGENMKVSLLYLFRLIRNSLFCRGNKMPLILEVQRHAYHFNLSKKLFGKIKLNYWWLGICAAILLIYLPLFVYFLSLADHQLSQGAEARFVLPVYGSDSVGYAVLADNLLEHKEFSLSQQLPYSPDTFRTPGYPLFLAVFKAIFGSYKLFPLLQILMVLIAANLIFKIGRELVSDAVGFLAALIFALNPNVIFHSLILLSDISYVFFLVLAFYLMFFSKWRNFYFLNLSVGILLGLAVLIRPISMFLLLLLLPSYYIDNRSRILLKKLLIGISILILGYLLAVTPWVARNKTVSGTWGISSVGAFNLFHYNIPEFLSFKHGITPDDGRLILRKDLGEILPEDTADLSHSGLLNRISGKYLKEDLIGYAKFHLIKTTPFFLSSGIKNIFVSYNDIVGKAVFNTSAANMTNLLFKGQFKEFLRELKVAPLVAFEQFGWLLILAFALIPIFLKKNKLYISMFWLIIIYFAVLTGPVAYARFRLPGEPFLFLLAAIGFNQALILFRKKLKLFGQ